jgi:hypothetical protein
VRCCWSATARCSSSCTRRSRPRRARASSRARSRLPGVRYSTLEYPAYGTAGVRAKRGTVVPQSRRRCGWDCPRAAPAVGTHGPASVFARLCLFVFAYPFVCSPPDGACRRRRARRCARMERGGAGGGAQLRERRSGEAHRACWGAWVTVGYYRVLLVTMGYFQVLWGTTVYCWVLRDLRVLLSYQVLWGTRVVLCVLRLATIVRCRCLRMDFARGTGHWRASAIPALGAQAPARTRSRYLLRAAPRCNVKPTACRACNPL